MNDQNHALANCVQKETIEGIQRSMGQVEANIETQKKDTREIKDLIGKVFRILEGNGSQGIKGRLLRMEIMVGIGIALFAIFGGAIGKAIIQHFAAGP